MLKDPSFRLFKMEVSFDTDLLDAAVDFDFDIDMTDIDIDDSWMEETEFMIATPKNFLDLPENVRMRIYEYSGLIRSCPVDVATEKFRRKSLNHSACLRDPNKREVVGNWNTSFGARLCDHPPFPLGIFLVSRAVYRDAFSAFYGQNKFRVRLCRRDDLSTFYGSTRSGLKYIRSLHVDLNSYDNRIIKTAQPRGSVLNLWHRFSGIVVKEMLDLKYFSIKCRVKDEVTAEEIVERIGYFPILSGCAFHLNALPIGDVTAVAKRAALDATTVPEDTVIPQPFPFRELPKELQLMILRYLLIVRWDPFIHSFKSCVGYTALQSHKEQRAQDVNSLMCCGTCSVTGALCFCSYGQTAVSSRCSCFTSPLPYFLVNREMYEDASSIFYSNNRFVFIQENPDHMMRFFHPFSNVTLAKIRHLVFKFPPVYRTYGSPLPKFERTLQLSWSMVLRFIKEHLFLERLSLVIVDLGTLGPQSIRSDRNEYLRRLLTLFWTIRGVQTYHVFLIDDAEFECTAEQVVMGPEYESAKSNKVPFHGYRQLRASRT